MLTSPWEGAEKMYQINTSLGPLAVADRNLVEALAGLLVAGEIQAGPLEVQEFPFGAISGSVTGPVGWITFTPFGAGFRRRQAGEIPGCPDENFHLKSFGTNGSQVSPERDSPTTRTIEVRADYPYQDLAEHGGQTFRDLAIA